MQFAPYNISSHSNHISNVRWLLVAGGYYSGQCRLRVRFTPGWSETAGLLMLDPDILAPALDFSVFLFVIFICSTPLKTFLALEKVERVRVRDLLLHLFMHLLVDSFTCPDRESNYNLSVWG